MNVRALFVVGSLLLSPHADATVLSIQELNAQFARQVDHQVMIPEPAQTLYIQRVKQVLKQTGITPLTPKLFLVVDRNPQVQAAFLLLRMHQETWHWIGATAVSTGKPGAFNHFLTPLGAFLHSPRNPDYRAAGTYNKNHIRGYGVTGMRVYDFGWQLAPRGWGKGGISPMRLAMHATDPQRLEARLGHAASEGCIRIPNSLNHFLDHYGVIDGAYEEMHAEGKNQRVLLVDRDPLQWAGQYVLVIDSQDKETPKNVLLQTPTP